MKVSNELKDNLIADVENILSFTLSDADEESLKRCFEITIGHTISELQVKEERYQDTEADGFVFCGKCRRKY